MIDSDKKELEFYRTLKIHRDDGVTAIGGDTADKLHDLYTEIFKLRELVGHLQEEI
jgi:hypothetical protein